MFKKAIVATAVLAASTGFAFANGGTYQAPHATHSAYIGVAVSRDFFSLSSDNSHKYSNRNYYNYNSDFGNDGWDGELNAGLGWVFQDHYYLGAEIFGTVNNAKINQRYGYAKYEYSYGIDFVPGVKISDSTMLYGKVGYVRGEFKFRGANYKNKSNGRNGLQLGIGMETMITNNVSGKIEYDWNDYSKSYGYDVNVDSVKLGVAYHFMSA